MPSKYAWQFPDGEVIPHEDEFAIFTKLRASDDFVNRVSDDEYYRGEWYRNEYNSELESIIDDPEYLLDRFGVRYVSDSRRGPRFRLPDGRLVGLRDLELWFVDEAYPFEDWLRYNQFSSWFFEDVVDHEIEYLIEENDPESLGYYGIERVPLASSVSKKASSRGKPMGKAPAKKTTGKPASKSTRTKAKTKTKASTKTKGRR